VKGITGRPTAGARLVLEKAGEGEGSVVYRGFVHLPDSDIPAEAQVSAGSPVAVTLGEGGTPELTKWVAALVRAAAKGAAPRKIVRWRG
jgi:hypothetical protein